MSSAWSFYPHPRNVEEVHEALSWMGWVTDAEAVDWRSWLAELALAGRVVHEGERWLAVDSTRDPKLMLRGRLEALGPVFDDDPLLYELERDGVVLRTVVDGRPAWCERRLLARIRNSTLDALRREVEPVSAHVFVRFLQRWQHATEPLTGPGGLEQVLHQLAGFEATPTAWEREILPARVSDFRREWLDQLGLSGRITWGRLWGAGRTALRATPLAFFPREQADLWLGFERSEPVPELSWPARAPQDTLAKRGASFADELPRATGLLSVDVDRGLAELVALGLASSDNFGALRHLMRPPSRRNDMAISTGRWALLERSSRPATTPETLARALLVRYGVLFRALLERERAPLPWRDLVRALRLMELRGEVRGGRFVERFTGEQYALPHRDSALAQATPRADGTPRPAQERPAVDAAAPRTVRNVRRHGFLRTIREPVAVGRQASERCWIGS